MFSFPFFFLVSFVFQSFRQQTNTNRCTLVCFGALFYHYNKNREHRCSTKCLRSSLPHRMQLITVWFLCCWCCSKEKKQVSIAADPHHRNSLFKILILDIKCSFISIGDFSSTSSHSNYHCTVVLNDQPFKTFLELYKQKKKRKMKEENSIWTVWWPLTIYAKSFEMSSMHRYLFNTTGLTS